MIGYLRYKFRKEQGDSAVRFFRKPTTWYYIYVGVLIFFTGRWYITGNVEWLYASGVALIVIFLITLWLDYMNQPWRTWERDRRVRESVD